MARRLTMGGSLLFFKCVALALYVYPFVAGLDCFGDASKTFYQSLHSSVVSFAITALIYLVIVFAVMFFYKLFFAGKIAVAEAADVAVVGHDQCLDKAFAGVVLLIDIPLAILAGLTRFVWSSHIATTQNAIHAGATFLVLFIILNFLSTLIICVARKGFVNQIVKSFAIRGDGVNALEKIKKGLFLLDDFVFCIKCDRFDYFKVSCKIKNAGKAIITVLIKKTSETPWMGHVKITPKTTWSVKQYLKYAKMADDIVDADYT